MKESDADKQTRQRRRMPLADLPSNGNPRRKFLGMLGMGVVGAFAMKMLPTKIFSRGFLKRQNSVSRIKLIPNELAVKRGKRV